MVHLMMAKVKNFFEEYPKYKWLSKKKKIKKSINGIFFPVTDAVEDKYVYVNESLTINGGQGLFAKVDIPGGTNFAYFGGHVYTDKQWNATTFFDPNYFAKFKDGKQQYFVHLPDEFGNDLNLYR